MEKIFGKVCFNKNLAFEMAKYMCVQDLVKMASSSKRARDAYTQNIIWWAFLYTSFEGLRIAENFLFHDDNKKMNPAQAMRAYLSAGKIIKTPKF